MIGMVVGHDQAIYWHLAEGIDPGGLDLLANDPQGKPESTIV
jgi:hypothetical protein